jgi:hypothetical protein
MCRFPLVVAVKRALRPDFAVGAERARQHEIYETGRNQPGEPLIEHRRKENAALDRYL